MPVAPRHPELPIPQARARNDFTIKKTAKKYRAAHSGLQKIAATRLEEAEFVE
jgi:hypothetical protein